MKEAAVKIAAFSQSEISVLEQHGKLNLQIGPNNYTIELQDVEITADDIPGWSVASKGALTVALDITITDSLRKEGDAREFVNRVQNIRKESGFDLTDRIFVQIEESPTLKASIIEFNDYICREILADGIDWVPQMATGTEIEVNDVLLKVVVNKKG